MSLLCWLDTLPACDMPGHPALPCCRVDRLPVSSLLQEELQQQRKTLRVALGSSVPPPPPQQQQQPGSPKGRGSGQPGSPKGRQQGGGGAGDSGQQQQQHGANGTMADTVKNNPVISKYFSVRVCSRTGQPGGVTAAFAPAMSCK